MSISLALALAALLQAPSPPPTTAPATPGQRKEAAPRPEAQPPKEAQPPTPTKGLRKRLKATLVAIDPDAMTISFRDESGRTQTWPVNQRIAAASPVRAAQAFKTLNPGDSVWILYSDDDGPATIMDMRRVRARPAGADQPGR